MINELAYEIYENNVKKGFYDDEKNIGEMIALVQSEASEALECDRKDQYIKVDILDAININDASFENYFEKKT